MLDQFLDFIDRNQLCTRYDSTLLAASGGIDSMVMLYLFREAGFKIGVAHANFQLRGAESDGDQQFVAQLCKEFNIPFFTRRFETEEYAWEKTLSVQIAARELRYAWFRELAATNHYQHIATAHHFDDTMETILLNLTRGTGLDGLSGIPVKNGAIIRPMMFASRKQVEKYADMHGLVWREDASNQTDNYQRNYIRHHVMPHLRELNPSLEATWRSGLRKVNHEIGIVQQAFELWKDRFVHQQQGRAVIAKAAVEEYPNNPAMLWRYIRNFGFNFEQAGDIQGALDGQSGKRFFSSTHMLVVDREQLIIIDRTKEWNELKLVAVNDQYHLGPWMLTVQEISERAPVDYHRAVEEHTAVLDASKLSLPLIWRKWKAGDYFYPLGLGHRKKLSDFFVDEKLSVADKDKATVIESGGEIIWVSGLRIDDRFKITDKTIKRIELKISHF
ncbi:MAG TPA: tRNA lysidine(34) synthetase TilS [Chryseolinea sp.]|nr:tRNA lysidine(34) synthetase TilS [Chryseolinea sp.]